MQKDLINKKTAYVSKKTSKYLERIGISPSEPLYIDLETLKKLQYAHVTHVPYENLSIINDIPISLDIEKLYDKIVIQGRGGYCFEVNALFNLLLRDLGFRTESLFARFLRNSAEIIPMRRHRVMRVFLAEGEYLADVGIGSPSPRYPVEIREGAVSRQFSEEYVFTKDEALGWILQERKEDGYHNIFCFTDEPMHEVDFRAASFWCEKHPDSPFNKQIMVSLKTEDGRMTLDGNIFKIFSGDHVTSEQIAPEHINDVLEKYFNLRITK